MIKPHKYLNLEYSTIKVGAIILTILKKEESIKYNELLDKLTINFGEATKELFLPTLSMLYILGKVEYNKELDLLIYLK